MGVFQPMRKGGRFRFSLVALALRVGTGSVGARRRRVRAYKRGRCYFATGGRLLPCPMAKLCRGARKERRIQRLRNGRVAKNKHASCVRKEFFNHMGAVCRAQELWLSDNLHSRSRSVRPTRRMSSQHCATGARSRPRCGSRDPANLLMTSPGRDEAPWPLPNPDGGELVPPTFTINRSTS
jgi:hypothetical protein